MEKEIWKDIPWYEWLYEASNLGNIFSFDKKVKCRWWNFRIIKWKILKWKDNWKWYKAIHLIKNWINTRFYIHRLILLTFIWKNDLHCNHKNWIRNDNRLENLEYCTASENHIHKYRVLKRIHPLKWKEPWNKGVKTKILY